MNPIASAGTIAQAASSAGSPAVSTSFGCRHFSRLAWLRLWEFCKTAWTSLQSRQSKKAMRLCETVSLGDKRLVAILSVGEQRYLIGASPSNISLLAQLPDSTNFDRTLQSALREGNSQ